MWFLYLLGIVVAIVIDYVIAKKFEEIAEMKGHEGSTYFWFTFIFGIVGMLMVIALPNKNVVTEKNMTVEQTAPTSKEATIPTSIPMNFASTEKNPNKTKAPVSAEIKDGEKVCPKCGAAQRADRRVCWSCGQPFDN